MAEIGILLICLLCTLNTNAQYSTDLSNTATDICFRNKNIRLNNKAKQQLDRIAAIYKADTSIRITLSTLDDYSSEKYMERSWNRMQSVMTYLTKGGINSDHISMNNFIDTEANKVVVSITHYSISLPTAPHPPVKTKL